MDYKQIMLHVSKHSDLVTSADNPMDTALKLFDLAKDPIVGGLIAMILNKAAWEDLKSNRRFIGSITPTEVWKDYQNGSIGYFGEVPVVLEGIVSNEETLLQPEAIPMMFVCRVSSEGHVLQSFHALV